MPMTVSNPRDLLVLLLGEILHVERRLAGGVLQSLVDDARDEPLRASLADHLEKTHRHVERVETVFRRIEVAPSAHFCAPFEAAVTQHDAAAHAIRDPVLRDCFHAQAALHTEQWEVAAYTSVAILAGGATAVDDDTLALVQETLRDEEAERDQLESILRRLASSR